MKQMKGVYMDRCYNCERWEEKYDYIKGKYDRLCDSYSELEKKFNKTESELQEANWKVKYELEPRIESEHRSYDSYVLSGGSDECFSNGMSGNCGVKCSIFGDKSECYEKFTTEEDILWVYEEYGETKYLSEIIDKMGLREKVKELDRKYYIEQIKKCKETIKKLENELNKI
jgi:hypothetical protein